MPMVRICWAICILFLCLLALPERACADTIIVTKAMTATTVAEFFVTEETVRAELEIGVPDIPAFAALMPDELYEQLGREREPLASRLRRFLREDFAISADGVALPGRVTSLTVRPRIKRDEITGEPLPVQPEEAELVVYVEFEWSLTRRPQTLTIGAPTREGTTAVAANIGFVLYHLGLPVTDFRYLGAQETVRLDWDDPWFSRFENRNLRRQYDAPIMAFLYVDPFEVRKEIIARPKDLQQWVDLGLDGQDTIRAEDQAELKQRVAEFLSEHNRVLIDGREVESALDRIHFVRRTLRTTTVVDPPEDLDVLSATLGIIFIYPIAELPQEVTMEWELFSKRIPEIRSWATDEAGGLPYTLSADWPVLKWENFLKNPSGRELATVAPPPDPPRLPIPLVSVVCGLLTLAALRRTLANDAARRARSLILAGALAAGMVALWPFARVTVPIPFAGPSKMAEAEAADVLGALLRNVYRAFDYRDESTIYDVLERSAKGELLTDIYLETQRALVLRKQGGARVKVQEVEMVETDTTNLEGEVGFVSRCTWVVTGSVGHWGHIHQRQNKYVAQLTVKPIAGVWRITGLELLDEQRI